MKQLLAALAGAFLVVSCATPTREQGLVDRAVNAMGGAERIAAINTISVRANVKHWEPEQSDVAGGEPRFGAPSPTARSSRPRPDTSSAWTATAATRRA